MNTNILKITLIALLILSGCAAVEPYNYVSAQLSSALSYSRSLAAHSTALSR